MDDLITWLRAQIDEDERIAKAASKGPWRRVVDDRVEVTVWDAGEPRNVVAELSLSTSGVPGQGEADAAHIAAHDPARVLREVEAKRRLIELHKHDVKKVAQAPFDPMTGEHRPDEYEVTCDVCGWSSDDPTSACETLRLLALPFSDRPGYREEWRP